MFADDEHLPTLSLIVSAFNAEARLQEKIKNCLKLYYPKGKLQILFVSEKHDEKAQETLGLYRTQGIANLRKVGLKDHQQAYRLGSKIAQGEILVFCTCLTDFNDMALINLAQNFKEYNIGAVSGKHSIYESINSHTSLSHRLYDEYQSIINHQEGLLESTTHASNQLIAIRKSLYKETINHHLVHNDAILITALENKCRVIYEPLANAYSPTPKDISQDFKLTRKKSESSYRLIFSEWGQLFPPKTLFRFMFFSHRFLDLIMPLLLAALLVSSFALSHITVVKIFLYFQLTVYGFSVIIWGFRNSSIFRSYPSLIMYFVMMNIAKLSGFLVYVYSVITGLFSRKKAVKAST